MHLASGFASFFSLCDDGDGLGGSETIVNGAGLSRGVGDLASWCTRVTTVADSSLRPVVVACANLELSNPLPLAGPGTGPDRSFPRDDNPQSIPLREELKRLRWNF